MSHRRIAAIGLVAAGLLPVAAPPAAARQRPSRPAQTAAAAAAAVTVDYGVALAGLPIGTARLSGAFDGARYDMGVSAQLTGLVGVLTGGQGQARSSGRVAERPLPSAFAIATRTSSSGIAVRMALSNGNVAQAVVTPPLVDMSDRVPVTAAAKRGIVDPTSALVMPLVGRSAATDPANCERRLPVFDGATRFDVVLSYAETRMVEKPGYSGPVLVCNARYVAIGGHRPDRPGVRFMEENRDMSVWLAPVAGTRVLLPLRIAVRTQIGTNIIEATRWTQSGAVASHAQQGRAPSEASADAPAAQASLSVR